jgi:carbonic anhydrase
MTARSIALLCLIAAPFFGCSSNSTSATSDEAPREKPAAEQTVAAEVPVTQEPAPIGDVLDASTQRALTPDAVLERLREGNARFVKGEGLRRDYRAQVSSTASGQYPAAVILSCIDSRVPAEIVFDQGIGDVFSARVAGNVVDDHTLGSMEFATKVAGAKLVVVMGHTSCGAVKGACDDVQLGHISALVSTIRPSVEAVTPRGETCSEDELRVDEVASHNVGRTMNDIRDRSPILSQLENDGTVRIVGAMYDVNTGVVTFL